MRIWRLAHRRLTIAAVCIGGIMSVGALAVPASAGTFVLHQCGGAKAQKGGFQPAEPHGLTFQVVDGCSDGGSAPALEVSQVSNGANERRGFWYLAAADPSLRFTRVDARVKLISGSNTRSRLVATNLDPTNGTNGTDWGTFIADGTSMPNDWVNVTRNDLNHSTIKLGAQCFATTCSVKDGSVGNPVQVAKGRNFEITISDSGQPSVGVFGSLLADGSLIRGAQSGVVSATDSGAGVHFIQTRVNGTEIQETVNDCPDVAGTVAVTQSPCSTGHTDGIADDVDVAPWRYGANSVAVCAYDYTTSGPANTRCTHSTVNVDNRADGPTSLLGAPSGWINDRAKFSASVGVPSSVAPLTKMHYRLNGPGAYEQVGYKTSGFGSMFGAELPPLGAPGEYMLRIWFEDSLGNVNEGGTAKAVGIKYDPVKPEEARLERHNGWLASFDFDPGFDQRWSKPRNDSAYPSGLRGYAVEISPDPDRDPCDGGSTPGCDPEEITQGSSSQSLRLQANGLADGRYYINTVPVTNADNRGPRDQAKLFIDRTNPDVVISGVPNEWSRERVNLSVHAKDTMSGMARVSADEMPAGPALTAIRVGDDSYEIAEGDTVRTTIVDDGVHRVNYYARDLAGNRNDGSVDPASGFHFTDPGTATARIDGTAPTGAFRRASREDPTLQRIRVEDATSGIADVTLQLRRKGTVEWYTLGTAKDDGEYTTRIDESQWPEGTYEIRAVATDVAGNTATLDSFTDGASAELELPLREKATATIDAAGTRAAKDGSDSRWHKVRYLERPVYQGVLRDSDGDRISGARVNVRERFDAGTTVKKILIPTVTDGDGQYRVTGSAGPSRAARLLFDGDGRYRPTQSTFVRTLVRGRVALRRYPRRIAAGKPAAFVGAIAHEGVKIPDRGKIYEVQILVPREGWKTLDQAQRSRPNGRFRFVYRFRPVVRAVTFRMRIQVKRDPEWAYTQARSRKVSVTVTP